MIGVPPRRRGALAQPGVLVELQQLAGPSANHGVGVGVDEALDLFQQRLRRGAAAGDEGDREARALMDVLQADFRRGDLKTVAELVAQRLHHHALLFQRLRVLDVELEKGDRDDHANAGSSFSTLKASMTSPTLMSWNFSMPMPHSKPCRTSETSFLKCRSEPIFP